MGRLDTMVALVTGGAQGIGKTIAQRFVQEGASIAIADYNLDGARATADDLAASGAKVKAFRINVADESSVETAIQEVIAEFGRIDILINNAGITRDTLMMRMKREDWDAVIGVNLTGAFLVAREVIKHMVKARSGRIVNMASVVGVMGNAGQANYSASKAGLIGLTKTMAKEFAGRNITVNALAPGFILTDMTNVLSDEAKEAFLSHIPLKRPGTPMDVANAALFFASSDASYITGQVMCVDGGMIM